MMKYSEFLKKIVAKNGVQAQSLVAMEECSELIQAISKMLREPSAEHRENLIEEVADVAIMIDQLREMYGIGYEELNEMQCQKMDRTIERFGLEEEN